MGDGSWKTCPLGCPVMHLGSTRTTPLIVIVALGLVCLCGYFARVLHESVSPRPVRWPVEPGDIALANSFSEAEVLKAALARSCATLLLDLHRNVAKEPSGDYADVNGSNEAAETTLRKLTQALHEFRGTEQELRITQALLAFHSRQQNNTEWLATYLSALYTHPTHPFVGEHAHEAVRRARSTGDPSEVVRALNHIMQIPSPLTSLEKVRTALDLPPSSD